MYNVIYTWRLIVNEYKVLDVFVDELQYNDIIDYISNTTSQIVVSSVNPEIILKCQEDNALRNIINSSQLRIADGIGTVWAVNKLHKKNLERITGIDLLENILKSPLKNKKIFFYGAQEGVAKRAMIRLNSMYECNIVGEMNGYEHNNEKVLQSINESDAEIVFVGLGCPKQELWIDANKSKLPNVKLLIGVGGSFDVLSGSVKRAPKAVQNLKLEWLYRLFKQPKRFVRQLSLVKYVFTIFRNKGE